MKFVFNPFTGNFDLVNDVSQLVTGPSSATDNAIVRYDGTTGKLVQDSLVLVTDTGIISNVTNPVSAQDAATKNYVDSNFANRTLSNLTSPTAINQNLIFGTGASRTIQTPNVTGNSNQLTLRTGNGTTGVGNLNITGGNASAGANGGSINIVAGNGGAGGVGGDIYVQSGAGATNIDSGVANFSSGNADGTGSTGEVGLYSGSAGGSGNTGDVVISTGNTSSGTRGHIRFPDGTEGTLGDLWTSVGTIGEGSWVTPDFIPNSEKGAANGVATLDGGGKVPAAQLPNSIMDYLGTWAASTNTPTLVNGTGNAGDVYVASDAGTVNFGAGAITFAAGDWVIYSGTVWQKSINSNAVASVNGFTGIVVLTQGNLTDVGTDGISITGGTNAVWGTGTTLSQHVADSTHNGYLSSTDFNSFSAKQPAGNYITALTGDATAAGPGSAALTLSTVNSNVGSFGTASSVSTVTVNAKGLVTAANNTSIQIAESQVTNLVSDLAGKQATGNYITALTGDVVATGPGSVSSTIQSNVVTNAKLAQAAATTLKGNATNATANVTDLTVVQAANMLGVPGTNYLGVVNGVNTNGNFELGTTTGWTLGTTGTLTNAIPTGTPTFGSGASGTLAISATSTSPITGTYSLSYADSAATTSGNMVASSAVTIDRGSQAKTLGWSFSYVAQTNPTNGNFSGTSSNSFGVAVYDVTNSAWLSVTGNFNLVQNSGVGSATGTVTTSSTTASLRFIIYNANASSGAITMYFDSLFLGPQVTSIAPAMNDWVSYTPTGSWITNTTYAGKYARVGDSLYVQALVSLTGAPTSATLTINLPSGLTIDTTKLANSGGNQIFGNFQGTSNTSSILGVVLYNNTTSVTPQWDNPATQASYLQNFPAARSSITQNSPRTFANGDAINLIFGPVPIVGWSSNTVSSADTDSRIIAMEVNQSNPTATITSTLSLLKFTSAPLKDTAGGFSTTTGLYTVPVTGYYRVTAAAQVNGTYAINGSCGVGISQNAVAPVKISSTVAGGSMGGIFTTFSDTMYCNAGDTLGPYVSSTATGPTISASATLNYFNVERLSGPAVVQATDSVNGRYYASATSISGSLATIVWTTKDFDSHNAMSSGVVTIPVSGKYQFNTNVQVTGTIALNSVLDAQLQKNTVNISEFQTYAGGAMTAQNAQISDTISCLAGDSIRLQLSSSATLPVIASGNTKVYFSWERVGN